MAAHMFPNFLRDTAQYRAAEEFWEELWNSQIERGGLSADWVKWLNTEYSDGTSFGDGNPIFTRISLRDGRAVRVILTEPRSNIVALDYWIEETSSGGSPDLCIRELVISCELSAGAAQIATELIWAWVRNGEITLRSELTESVYSGTDEDQFQSSECLLVA